jgi:hypothetical protein
MVLDTIWIGGTSGANPGRALRAVLELNAFREECSTDVVCALEIAVTFCLRTIRNALLDVGFA